MGTSTSPDGLYKPAAGETGWATLVNASTDIIQTRLTSTDLWAVDVNVYMTPIAQTNWNTVAVDALMLGGGYQASDTTQNAEINFDVVLSAGTWTFELMHTRSSNVGIYTVSLDGVTAGTIDGYNGSASYNTRSTITGISVAAAGVKRLKLKMATKNASSSAYQGVIQAIQFRRTA